MNAGEAQKKMNDLGGSNRDFFFLISFNKNRNLVFDSTEWKNQPIYFQLPLKCKLPEATGGEAEILDIRLSDLNTYQIAFKKVKYHLNQGNSYLVNLTVEVPISLEGSLRDLFCSANSTFKVYLEGHFVSFSPEPFIKIENNRAFTFPMKGTISASVPNAEEIILNDAKEEAEHNTIVDLLRNDLSSIGRNTKVNRFRYVSSIKRKGDDLLQVSSEIECRLDDNWPRNIGTLLFRMLPAGSISGAPKKRTVEIIHEAENHDRQWYTGVAGIYSNRQLNSTVLIRYIGRRGDQFFYKTGGGITYMSDLQKEYEELRTKIYIPVS